eukprot:gnl/TRDRNA2_/TRDRNA2_194143_c0_seq1.p1 gnl/TRDRNA2_/TRDRNA2_194143_c0~~gnl/TRDRNA2_/TRDRNA2_194143_c0_seq1.p1  ORF type:complete len:277 (+),score=32.43 gnl/TRDRNA2_/TRDRNA2_194143_c0_seq1:70-900(+)
MSTMCRVACFVPVLVAFQSCMVRGTRSKDAQVLSVSEKRGIIHVPWQEGKPWFCVQKYREASMLSSGGFLNEWCLVDETRLTTMFWAVGERIKFDYAHSQPLRDWPRLVDFDYCVRSRQKWQMRVCPVLSDDQQRVSYHNYVTVPVNCFRRHTGPDHGIYVDETLVGSTRNITFVEGAVTAKVCAEVEKDKTSPTVLRPSVVKPKPEIEDAGTETEGTEDDVDATIEIHGTDDTDDGEAQTPKMFEEVDDEESLVNMQHAPSFHTLLRMFDPEKDE